ncbi:transposase [Sphaerisporangium sp. TRM90804]|uniref:transposase n=1 Tax=Sphaerisporangium sp. TRM90804 TaxID=3031113 RepID=UPI00244CA5A8|nr:transposase [Sphaerisporangium sp. TRM90804]MDH2424280.1 transposase [Sphaerisporangium sp. TRM90804]
MGGGPGYEVEPIRLDGRVRLRVRQYGFVVAYCRSLAEVARYVSLDELVELFILPSAGARSPRG